MRITRLIVENVRGVPNGTYPFAHTTTGAPLATVLIAGPAGSGKTSLLEAIAAVKELVGAYGHAPSPRSLLARGTRTGRIEASFLLDAAEMKHAQMTEASVIVSVELSPDALHPLFDPDLRALFSSFEHLKLEYFPANRRLTTGSGARATADREDGLRATKAPGKYDSVSRTLATLALGAGLAALERLGDAGLLIGRTQKDSLGPYRKAIADMLPHLRLSGVEMRADRPEVLFERRDGVTVTLAELSDGEQQVVLFAVTFLRHGLHDALVLVDLPELFIDGAEHVSCMRWLSALGTNNQIIAATTSTELLRHAAPHEIVRLSS